MNNLDAGFVLAVIFRWVHILSAVTAIGGLLFMRLVLLPSAVETLSEDEHARLRIALMRRWRKLVSIAILLLLVTGIYNFITIGVPKGKDIALYHPLFGVKFLAALCVFFITSALVGRSPALAPMRANMKLWLTVNATLAVFVILISGILRNLD